MTAATGLQATVDVAHEAGAERIGPRTDGADLCVDIGRPLRVALLVGREPEIVAAAEATALRSCVDIVQVLSTGERSSLIERAAALRDARPDAVLVLSDPGDAGGMVELIEALRLGCEGRATPPILLAATDESTRRRIAASAGSLPVEAMPSPNAPRVRDAIVSRLRGLRRTGGDTVLRDEAIEGAARALAAARTRSTLVIDVSGGSTSLALATPDGAVTAVHSRLGVGAGADRIVARGGLERVRRWIPRPIDGPALLERIFNRARWPDALPSSVLTLSLEMSLAREAIAQLLRDAERAGVAVASLRDAEAVAATGHLARFPRAAQTVLVIADALGPDGTQLISRERLDALVAAGAIASRAATDVSAATVALALVVTHLPTRSASVTVTDATGETVERVARGAFFLMPTTGPVTVGKRSGSGGASAETLQLGVVIDARGRPLELPPRDAERLPTIARWYSALAALPFEGGPL